MLERRAWPKEPYIICIALQGWCCWWWWWWWWWWWGRNDVITAWSLRFWWYAVVCFLFAGAKVMPTITNGRWKLRWQQGCAQQPEASQVKVALPGRNPSAQVTLVLLCEGRVMIQSLFYDVWLEKILNTNQSLLSGSFINQLLRNSPESKNLTAH